MELQNSPLIWCVETCLVIDELTRDIGKLLRIFPVDHKVYQQTTIALQQLAMNEKFKIHEQTSLCVLKITFFFFCAADVKIECFRLFSRWHQKQKNVFQLDDDKKQAPTFRKKKLFV